MGIKDLINRNAPSGEQVAFINEREADLLRRSGGSGRTDNNPYGIPSYDDVDESGGDEGDYSGEGDSDYGGGDGGASTSTFGNVPSSRPTGSVPANSVNPTGRTTDQIVFDDNYNRLGSFGNLYHSLNPQGTQGTGRSGGSNPLSNLLAPGQRKNIPQMGTPELQDLMNSSVLRDDFDQDRNYYGAEAEANDFTSFLSSLFGFQSPVEYNADTDKYEEGTEFSIMDNPALDLVGGALTGGVYPSVKNAAKNIYRGNYINAIVDAVAPTSVIQANDLASYVDLSLSDMRKGNVLQDPGMITRNIDSAYEKAKGNVMEFPGKVKDAYTDAMAYLDGDPNADVKTTDALLGNNTALFGGTALTNQDYANAFGDDGGTEQTSPLRMLQPTSPAVAPVQQQILAELVKPTRTGTGLAFDWTKPATGRRYFNTPTLTDYV